MSDKMYFYKLGGTEWRHIASQISIIFASGNSDVSFGVETLPERMLIWY